MFAYVILVKYLRNGQYVFLLETDITFYRLEFLNLCVQYPRMYKIISKAVTEIPNSTLPKSISEQSRF